MKTWLRLVIPVGLGLAAVWLNTTVMNSKLQPQTFIVVTDNLEAGDSFRPSSIGPRSFSGKVADLLESAVPWEDRAVILGREVPRPLRSGDLVLWRDATPPARELTPDEGEASLPISLGDIDIVPNLLLVGEEIGFYVNGSVLNSSLPINYEDPEKFSVGLNLPGIPSASDPHYIGPFRILSVGQRLTRTSEESSNRDSQIITIAIPEGDASEGHENTRILLKARATNGGVMAIVLHRSKRSPDAIRSRYQRSTSE
jgi:hypothetical protein